MHDSDLSSLADQLKSLTTEDGKLLQALSDKAIKLGYEIYGKNIKKNHVLEVEFDARQVTVPATENSMQSTVLKAFCAYLIRHPAKSTRAKFILAAVQKRKTREQAAAAMVLFLRELKAGTAELEKRNKVPFDVEKFDSMQDPMGGKGPQSVLGL